MTVLTDAELYLGAVQTLLGSWEEYARGATDAAVQRCQGVAAAVFPNEPERAVYNNAFLEHGLAAAGRADALDAMEPKLVGHDLHDRSGAAVLGGPAPLLEPCPRPRSGCP
jgi:hypothetical protein